MHLDRQRSRHPADGDALLISAGPRPGDVTESRVVQLCEVRLFAFPRAAIGAIRDVQPSSVTALREFAEIGVVLLLFLIGLEIKPPQLRELGRDAIGLGVP